MRSGLLALATAVVCLLAPAPVSGAQNAAAESNSATTTGLDAAPLRFDEMLVATAKALEPSPKLESLNGKRVRMVGYMAYQEEPPVGGFFLCARPTHNDESGGGTGDLPPTAVLVVVRSANGKRVEHITRPVEVTGILELGRSEREDGTISYVRLILDRPAESL